MIAQGTISNLGGSWVSNGKVTSTSASARGYRANPAVVDFPDSPAVGLFDSVFHEVDEAIAILSVSAEGIIIIDVNRQFSQQSGYNVSEIRGRDLLTLFAPDPDAHHIIENAVAQPISTAIETSLLRKAQPPVRVRLTLRPFQCQSNKAHSDRQFICVIRPNLSPANSDLIAKDITSRLLTFLSHDLRTPLNGILGFSEIMMTGVIGPLDTHDYKSYAKDIHHAGQDLLRLINGLLDLSHSTHGKLELCDNDFSLAACIKVCVDAFKERAADLGVTLKTRLSDELPIFRGDEARIRQVLLILISNALKYTEPKGTVTISLRQNLGGIEITVQDTGIGIAPNELACAFQPYRKIEDTYTNPRAGVGVGLPLAKVLVEQHDGSIAISSTLGQGTTITLRLPSERLNVFASGPVHLLKPPPLQ